MFAPAFTEESIALLITVLMSAPDWRAALTTDETAVSMFPSAFAVLLIAVKIAVLVSAPALIELLKLMEAGLDA
jgi:hypothetical protein